VNYRVYKDVEGFPTTRFCRNFPTDVLNWSWELIEVGDLLMYISQFKKDEEVMPRWIITSKATGEVRIRDLYIALYKLKKLEIVSDNNR